MTLLSDDFIEVSTGSERECNGIKTRLDRLGLDRLRPDRLTRMDGCLSGVAGRSCSSRGVLAACIDRDPSVASGAIPSRSIDGLGVR
jgi:hypothetical protein